MDGNLVVEDDMMYEGGRESAVTATTEIVKVMGDESPSKMMGVLTVIGGILVHLMIGNLYLWGNILPYVISYFHWEGDPKAISNNGLIIIPLSFAI